MPAYYICAITDMLFSKTCANAIRAMVFIAKNGDEQRRLSISEIATGIAVPKPFTAKILKDLSRKGLIGSVKGPRGGFYLNEGLKKISMADIVCAIDGDSLFKGCGLGLKECSEKDPCPIHYKYKHIRKETLEMLSQATMESFILNGEID